MIVEYDENIVNQNDIIKAVVDAGYNANVTDSNQNKSNKKEKFIDNSELIKSMKKRLIISIIFWLPLMYVAMYHMFNMWFGLPIPSFINNLFHGAENAVTFRLYTIFIATSNYIC